jgi:hypothetical protein
MSGSLNPNSEVCRTQKNRLILPKDFYYMSKGLNVSELILEKVINNS